MTLALDILPALTAAAGGEAGSWEIIKRTVLWLALAAVGAVLLLVNRTEQVGRVSRGVADNPVGALLIGVLVQFALLPLGLIVSAALALTVIGILAIPFALLGIACLFVALTALGLVGALHMWGRGTRRGSVAAATERGADLQALFAGLVTLALPWVAAALLRPVSGLLGGVVTILAVVVTWLFLTAGLGAAVRTRAGLYAHDAPWGRRRAMPGATPLPVNEAQPQWLTPTPITGVVAAKRPTAGSSSG